MKSTSFRFPTALRSLLTTMGVSQRWLLRKTDLSASTLNRILSGVQEPGRENLRTLCKAFPAEEDKIRLIIAHLQDELYASEVEPGRVLIREVDKKESENIHLLPHAQGYLRTISRELIEEQELPAKEQLISQQVEWLSGLVVQRAAERADRKPAHK